MKYMNVRRKYSSSYPFIWVYDKYLGVRVKRDHYFK